MPQTAAELLERLRDTIELLESIAADRAVLEGVPGDERKRLLQAVATAASASTTVATISTQSCPPEWSAPVRAIALCRLAIGGA